MWNRSDWDKPRLKFRLWGIGFWRNFIHSEFASSFLILDNLFSHFRLLLLPFSPTQKPDCPSLSFFLSFFLSVCLYVYHVQTFMGRCTWLLFVGIRIRFVRLSSPFLLLSHRGLCFLPTLSPFPSVRQCRKTIALFIPLPSLPYLSFLLILQS